MDDQMTTLGALILAVCAMLAGFVIGDSGGQRRADTLARALRDGEARVIAYQIDTQHCRAVLWQGQRLEEACEGEQ